ncbi:MAG: hypothetical protein KDC12_06395 [Flavobacteriales bacterium]|nr:hypothetical protein [Flavobacteriales bacterium]
MKSNYFLEGISFLPNRPTIGLHLVQNRQGKLCRYYHPVVRTHFEEQLLASFPQEGAIEIRNWINASAPSHNRWSYLNCKPLGCALTEADLSVFYSEQRAS